MKKILPFFAVLLLAGCASRESYDLLTLNGQGKPYHPTMPQGEMLPFSQVLKRESDLTAVCNPEKRKFLYVGFAEAPLAPGNVYRFTMRAAGREGLEIAAFLSEYHGETLRFDRNLLRATLFLNANGMTQFQKDFAVTPGATKAIPCITFFSRSGTMNSGSIALLETLSIEKVGKMKTASPAIRATNLAGKYDFDRFPAGNFQLMHKGNGSNAAKWRDVQAEVIELPGEGKALRIVRHVNDYVYPYLELEPFPADPQYHYVKLTFEAKGRGAFRTGIWWQRRHLEWDYENAPLCRLTDQWQTFTVYRPCLTPDVVAPTLAFNSADEGEYFIRRISVTLE